MTAADPATAARGTRPAARVLVVQHEEQAPLCRFSAVDGLSLHVLRPDRGDDVPSAAEEYDGLIVLGGSMAAWDDEAAPWLPATRALLAASVCDGTPTLGICLGGQLLAMATGGTVERGDAGSELGVVPLAVTPAATDDPLAGRLPEMFWAPQAHQDAITQLPPDAVLLATGRRYRHQMYRVGDHAWGVQYHPEVDGGRFRQWMIEDRDLLRREGSSPEQVMAAFDAMEDDLAGTASRHVQAFAGVVTARVERREHRLGR